jgi:predicted transglutaminase-like cysteine proteinase
MDNLLEQLDIIHNDIFSRFMYVPDIQRWGLSEHWERYDEIPEEGIIKGDCDCFALACRRECRKLDIQSRLVHVLTETNEGHLILSVDEYILDNRREKVVLAKDLPYKWFRISGYETSDPWRLIEGFK